MTDDKDRRLLNTILENLYNNKTLTEEYKFTSSGLYYAKHVDTREEYEQLVAGLPILPLPEAFGLHENTISPWPEPSFGTRALTSQFGCNFLQFFLFLQKIRNLMLVKSGSF